jgi:hypothetical protein
MDKEPAMGSLTLAPGTAWPEAEEPMFDRSLPLREAPQEAPRRKSLSVDPHLLQKLRDWKQRKV